jgi:hypothetical protein
MAQRYHYYVFTSDADVIYKLQHKVKVSLEIGGADRIIHLRDNYVERSNEEDWWSLTQAEQKKRVHGTQTPEQALALIKRAMPSIKKEGLRIEGSPSVEDVHAFGIKAIPMGINWSKTLTDLISCPGANVVYRTGSDTYHNDSREVLKLGSVDFKAQFGSAAIMDGVGIEGDTPKYVALRKALVDQWNIYCNPEIAPVKGKRTAGADGGDVKRTKTTTEADSDDDLGI